MSLWTRCGLHDNPYAVKALPANAAGVALLVGREREVEDLVSYLRSADTHATLEGDNGVGKTSLVFVAAYEALQEFKNGRVKQLVLPLPDAFQLEPADDGAAKLRQQVFFAIARAFETERATLAEAGLALPDSDAVQDWINRPIFGGSTGGGSVMGFGANFGSTSSPNTSAGFSEEGFYSTVESWLREAFPDRATGGFLAVIDNLELLEDSTQARKTLESIRDTLLDLPGVLWVLCGARGIVRTAASSSRLTSHLGTPIDVRPIADGLIAQVVDKRVDYYASKEHPNPPISGASFQHLYLVVHKNLRNALKLAQDVSLWLDREKLLETTREQRHEYLEVWLAQNAQKYAADAERSLQPRHWKLFDDVAAAGGICAPSEHVKFGFNNPQRMSANVAVLVEANLMQRTIDESDQRRRTIDLTSNGWIVRYQRSGYKLPAER